MISYNSNYQEWTSPLYRYLYQLPMSVFSFLVKTCRFLHLDHAICMWLWYPFFKSINFYWKFYLFLQVEYDPTSINTTNGLHYRVVYITYTIVGHTRQYALSSPLLLTDIHTTENSASRTVLTPMYKDIDSLQQLSFVLSCSIKRPVYL